MNKKEEICMVHQKSGLINYQKQEFQELNKTAVLGSDEEQKSAEYLAWRECTDVYSNANHITV